MEFNSSMIFSRQRNVGKYSFNFPYCIYCFTGTIKIWPFGMVDCLKLKSFRTSDFIEACDLDRLHQQQNPISISIEIFFLGNRLWNVVKASVWFKISQQFSDNKRKENDIYGNNFQAQLFTEKRYLYKTKALNNSVQ